MLPLTLEAQPFLPAHGPKFKGWIHQFVENAAEAHIQELTQQMEQMQAKVQSKDDAMAREFNAAEDRKLAWYNAETQRLAALQKNEAASAQLDQEAAMALLEHMRQEGQAQRPRAAPMSSTSTPSTFQGDSQSQRDSAAPSPRLAHFETIFTSAAVIISDPLMFIVSPVTSTLWPIWATSFALLFAARPP